MRDRPPGVLSRARALRRQLSPPELKLWLELKAGSQGGCPYRKQHPIGPYVLDFYAPAVRLCIEIDGYSHGTGDQEARNERRDAWLALSNITVVRIAASDILRDAGAVAEWLLAMAAGRVEPPPSASRPPPPRAGED